MQNVLSIDVTREPALAVVAAVDGRNIKILEKGRRPLGGLFSQEGLLAQPGANGAGAQNGAEDQPNGEHDASAFAELLAELKTPWTTSIMIVPPYEYLSLNLELPFADAKSINRVLDMEVQDLVPFDIAEFHIQHGKVAVIGEEAHDIHVSLMPKRYLERMLRICKESGLEPYIVCPPASALGAAFYLASDYLQKNSAIVWCDQNSLSVCVALDGVVRADRAARCSIGGDQAGALPAVYADLKLALSALEQRYHTKFDSIYLLGNSLAPRELQQTLGRNVEVLKADELMHQGDEETGLAGIASVFGQDFEAPPVLTNFRTREFAYSPQLGELLRGMKAVLPYAAAFVLLLVLLLAGRYYVRERRIHALETAIREQVTRVIPDLKGGNPDEAVTAATAEIEAELKDLGSFSAISPLEALMYVTEDLSRAIEKWSSIQVGSLSISPETVKLSVDTPGYKEFDFLERQLKKRDKVYCKVQRNDKSHMAASTKSSEFQLRLCKP